MAEVVWALPAVGDLEEIHSFIARDSERYATATVMRLLEAVGRLRLFPESGRVVPELPEGPYREVIAAPYRIVYRHEQPDRVLVMAVVHSSRLLPAVLEQRD